jgi:DNA-binding transcriptional ArsR family regulator
VAEPLDAIADPSRRAILELLRDRPRAVAAITADMPISRPAVSQHLKVLKDAGLVTDRAEGTRRVYALDPKGTQALRDYVESLWDAALGNLAATADADPEAPS